MCHVFEGVKLSTKKFVLENVFLENVAWIYTLSTYKARMREREKEIWAFIWFLYTELCNLR